MAYFAFDYRFTERQTARQAASAGQIDYAAVSRQFVAAVRAEEAEDV